MPCLENETAKFTWFTDIDFPVLIIKSCSRKNPKVKVLPHKLNKKKIN